MLCCIATSCQFSENIYMNEDGSGKMEFVIDASELMEMAAGMSENSDTTKMKDTTIVFRDMLKEKRDSIATLPQEDQDKLKSLENFTMHMEANADTKKVIINLSTEFKNPKELREMFEALNSFSNLQGSGGIQNNPGSNPFSSLGADGSTDINYAYDGTVFKRTSNIVDAEAHKQQLDSLGEMSMMFGGSNYQLNYHFPRPIKSSSAENAMYSADRKTISVEAGFLEVLKKPELLNIEVMLEDE